jgi:hypothetical protein
MARINRDMEVHMPRTSPPLRLALALACCLVGGSTLGAQGTSAAPPPSGSPVTTPATAGDSASRVRTLPTMRVTARGQKATREGVLALMQENRRLEAELRRQDEQVETLERRLAWLRGPATDSVQREITRFSTEATEVRARRQALEARLAAVEGTTASRP